MALGSLRIGVRAEPGHLGWLEEFLCPWFEPKDGGRCDTTVTLSIDPDRHAALLRRGARAGGERVEVFVLDSRLARHLPWSDDGPETVLDEELGVFYRVSRDGASAEVLAARGDAAARVALMGVVREVGTIHAQLWGAVILHAAAFGLEGRGVGVEAMRPDDALARLWEGLLGSRPDPRTSELFSGPAGPVRLAAHDLREACRTLTSAVPAYDCWLGEPIGETAAVSTAALRQLARELGAGRPGSE